MSVASKFKSFAGPFIMLEEERIKIGGTVVQ